MGSAKSVIQNLQGTEIFAMIGIILFLAFFVIVLIRVIRMKKALVGEYSHIPFDNDTEAGFQEDGMTASNNSSVGNE